MHLLITVGRSSFRLCRCIRHVMHKILGNISCDLGQIIYCLVNASSSKPLDVPTKILQVHRSHDKEGTGQNRM